MPIEFLNHSIRYVTIRMVVEYRDEIGVAIEELDENGISFLEGKAYFNGKVINMENLVSIRER